MPFIRDMILWACVCVCAWVRMYVCVCVIFTTRTKMYFLSFLLCAYLVCSMCFCDCFNSLWKYTSIYFCRYRLWSVPCLALSELLLFIACASFASVSILHLLFIYFQKLWPQFCGIAFLLLFSNPILVDVISPNLGSCDFVSSADCLNVISPISVDVNFLRCLFVINGNACTCVLSFGCCWQVDR